MSATSTAHLLLLIVVSLVTVRHTTAVTACGGKIDLEAGSTGTVTSPNYPNAYPTWTRCIWLIVAPSEYQVHLSITFEGETSTTLPGCGDYLEVRDGSLTSTELVAQTCGTLSLHNVTSSARWMWILFNSDGTNTLAGLTATYSTVYAGTSINNISSPVYNCHFYERQCPNLECISLSYICDGYSDCGCSPGCDEDDCFGAVFEIWERVLIGLGIGLGIFITVVVIVLGTDYYQRRMVEKEREKERLRQRFQKPLSLSRRNSRRSSGAFSPTPDSPSPSAKRASSHLEIP